MTVSPDLSALLAAVTTRAVQAEVATFSLPDAMKAIERAAASGDDLAAVKDTVRLQARTAKRSWELITSLLNELEAIEAPKVAAPSEEWMDRWRTRLQAALGEDDPDVALRSWCRLYVDALARKGVSVCEEALQHPVPALRENQALSQLAADGTRALRNRDWPSARALLRFLIAALIEDDASPAAEPGDAEGRESLAIVVILVGRIEMISLNRLEESGRRFKLSRSLAPESGLPAAALAVRSHAQGQYGDGLVKAQRAVQLSPQRPEGYVAQGMCTEAQGVPEATGFYDRAIDLVWDEDPLSALTHLLAPAPPTLLYRMAERALKEQRLQLALDTLDHAMEASALADQNEAEWRRQAQIRELEGRVREALDQPAETARALFQAGERRGWAGDAVEAVGLLRRARELERQLDGERAETCYVLADSLRMASFLPSPPYVNQELIEEAAQTWHDAARLEPPDTTLSWVFNARATINEQLARLAGTDRLQLWWQAVTDLERSLLLEANPAWTYGYLGQYYRLLELPGASEQAVLASLRLDPGNAAALEQRAILLYNAGRYEELLELLPSLANRATADALAAMALSRTGRVEEGLALITALVAGSDPPEAWMLGVLADCYQVLNRWEKARAESEKIWAQRTPEGREDQLTFAWAGFYLERYADALEVLEPIRGEGINVAAILRLSGLCRLGLGDLSLGQAELEAGISDATGVAALNDLIAEDLPFLKRAAGQGAEDAPLETAIGSVHQQVEDRLTELRTTPPSAERELAAIVGTDGPRTAWARVGAEAGLARLARDSREWRNAGSRYRSAAASGRFSEADLGLDRAVESAREAGDEALRGGLHEQALDHYRAALDLAAKTHQRPPLVRADLHARSGFCLVELDRHQEARQELARAIRWYAVADGRAPVEALVDVARTLFQQEADIGRLWDLIDGWSDLLARSQGVKDLHETLEAAHKGLFGLLDATLDHGEGTGDGFDPLPPPIVFELSAALIPEDTSPAGPLVGSFPDVRKHIQEQLGVVLPGIRAREGAGLQPGEYRVLLHGGQVILGKVNPDARYSLLPPEALGILGVHSDVVTAVRDPLTGARCCWVSDQEIRNLTQPVLATLLTPLAFTLRHLEGTLRRTIASLLGVEEVESLIEGWMEDDDAGPYRVLTALPDRRARLRFARLVRELVRDGVSASDWRRLLEAAKGLPLTADSLDTAVQQLRGRLRELLPGNQPAVHRFRLPAPEETRLAEASRRRDRGIPGNAGETPQLLQVIEDHVIRQSGPVALVVSSSELRLPIRELIDTSLELPNLTVLAADELLGDEPPPLPESDPEHREEDNVSDPGPS